MKGLVVGVESIVVLKDWICRGIAGVSAVEFRLKAPTNGRVDPFLRAGARKLESSLITRYLMNEEDIREDTIKGRHFRIIVVN